ncbi:facilitated trehalose transporter Tret1-like isoform X2 [Leptopilina heterotoma]|nr:facilitated trehalose transporter Tret1-like isoform X2 [Leptopilina heterotoma]
MIFSWTSPALPHLTGSASNFPVTELQGAWIASLVGCGTVSGFLLNPLLISNFGSKRTLIFLAAPEIISWAVIYLGKNWLLICFARIIGGFGYGAGLCSTAIYLSEIGDKRTRGIFLTLIKMSINIGIFISMFLGAFLSYDTMNLILMMVPIIFVVTFSSMPDAKDFQVDDFEDDQNCMAKFSDINDLQKHSDPKEMLNGTKKHLDAKEITNGIKKHSDNKIISSGTKLHSNVPCTESVTGLKKYFPGSNSFGDTENDFKKHSDSFMEDVVNSSKIANDATKAKISEQHPSHSDKNANLYQHSDDPEEVINGTSKHLDPREITNGTQKHSEILCTEHSQVPTELTNTDILKEDTVILLQNNTIVLVNNDTVDVVESKSIDFLNEQTSTLILDENFSKQHLDLNKETTCPRNSNSAESIRLLTRTSETILTPDMEPVQGENKTFEEEISQLLESSAPSTSVHKEKIYLQLFTLKNNRNALIIIMLAALTDIFSGHMVVVTYTQQIFEYSGASLKPEYAALILAILKIIASLISTVVVEKFGRRSLFLSTGIIAGLSQATVGLFFYLKLYLKINIHTITWLPLLGVSMYEVIGSIGLSSLYYVYQGELFADDVKYLGVTCTNISYEIITFFLKLYFQIVIDSIGIYSLFFGFGISCIIGSILVYWISPETKGKSKDEIQKLLS